MRFICIAAVLAAIPLAACAPASQDGASEAAATVAERNKRLAREFYEKVWFSNETDASADYFADEYMGHDIGDAKGVTEPGSKQKMIADRFHGMGNMSGEIDYQIAEGDKVATRWYWTLKTSEEMKSRGLTDIERLPIINVFRFNADGKIVEVWNHRHDIDIGWPPPPSPPD